MASIIASVKTLSSGIRIDVANPRETSNFQDNQRSAWAKPPQPCPRQRHATSQQCLCLTYMSTDTPPPCHSSDSNAKRCQPHHEEDTARRPCLDVHAANRHPERLDIYCIFCLPHILSSHCPTNDTACKCSGTCLVFPGRRNPYIR